MSDLEEIVHGYALAVSKTYPNRLYAVKLTGRVTADKIELMEPDGRHEPALHALTRILNAMDLRRWKRDWGKP